MPGDPCHTRTAVLMNAHVACTATGVTTVSHALYHLKYGLTYVNQVYGLLCANYYSSLVKSTVLLLIHTVDLVLETSLVV